MKSVHVLWRALKLDPAYVGICALPNYKKNKSDTNPGEGAHFRFVSFMESLLYICLSPKMILPSLILKVKHQYERNLYGNRARPGPGTESAAPYGNQ